MYSPRRLSAVGALLVGVFVYGLGLRLTDGADPAGPVLWIALAAAVVSFLFLLGKLSFEVDPAADEEG